MYEGCCARDGRSRRASSDFTQRSVLVAVPFTAPATARARSDTRALRWLRPRRRTYASSPLVDVLSPADRPGASCAAPRRAAGRTSSRGRSDGRPGDDRAQFDVDAVARTCRRGQVVHIDEYITALHRRHPPTPVCSRWSCTGTSCAGRSPNSPSRRRSVCSPSSSGLRRTDRRDGAACWSRRARRGVYGVTPRRRRAASEHLLDAVEAMCAQWFAAAEADPVEVRSDAPADVYPLAGRLGLATPADVRQRSQPKRPLM